MTKELDQAEKVRATRLSIAKGRFDILWKEYSEDNSKQGLANLEKLKKEVLRILDLKVMNPGAEVLIEGGPYFIRRVESLADWSLHPDLVPKTALTKSTREKIGSYTGRIFNDHYASLTVDTSLTTADFTGRERRFARRPAEEG